MNYANLHVHSEHSLLDGAAKIENLAKTAKEQGHTHLALTDHGSMSGLLLHKRACEKNGVQPIYGSELFLIEHFDRLKDNKFKQHNLHLTALAKDQRGFELMLQGLTYANMEGIGKIGKAQRPFLPLRYMLENGWKDHVVVLSGCSSSPFYNLTDSEGLELYQQYADYFGDDFYSELMPLTDWDHQKGVNEVAYEMAQQTGRSFVVTNDIHYCHPEDWELHELVIAFNRPDIRWSDPRRWKFSTHQNHFRTFEDMENSLVKLGLSREAAQVALLQTMEVAEKCSFKLNKYPLDLPAPVETGDEFDYFNGLIAQGFERRGLSNLPNAAQYVARLETEIEMLQRKGFIRYMLIVADAVNWAKQNGVFVGPARGSSGGSLVCYVMGITEVDPIKHGLLFERFIAPDRIDLPDIDVDVEDRKRHLVERYLKEKYGQWNVAHLTTYGTLLGRSALRDTARMFEVPPVEYDAAAKLLPKMQEGDARALNVIEDAVENIPEFAAFAEKHPRVVKFAKKLEGQVRNTGVHAAGYVLCSDDLRKSVRSYLVRSSSDILAVNWDKDDLEFFGLVKIDLLGLNTHSVIAECLDLIERKHGKRIDLTQIPLDDRDTIAAIGRGETMCVFTLMTPSMTRYCKDLQPETFEDIAATTALWRPGPIIAGMAKEYVDIRHGLKDPEYISDAHKAIVGQTRGQIIYQEQITELLVRFAGFTYSEADHVRKIVGKKKGAGEWGKWEEKFVSGCVASGALTEAGAKELWKRLEGFGSYAFNKSHSVAYGINAYWTAWLKVHYPAEYLCAYLNYGSTEKENKDGETNLDLTIQEALRLGLKILPPDINRSRDNWTVDYEHKGLRAGLSEVRNIGDAGKAELARLFAMRPAGFASVKDLMELVNKRQLNSRATGSLLVAGAFDTMPDVAEYRKLWKLENAKRSEYVNYNEAIITDRAKAMQDMAEQVRGEVRDEGEGPRIIYEQVIAKGDDTTVVSGNRLRKVTYEQANACLWPEPIGVLSGVTQSKAIRQVRKDTHDCQSCDLRQSCTKPVALELGKTNLMIVAEAPGLTEDLKGHPLIGKSGELLFVTLEEFGLQRADFYIDNTVHCRPPKNELELKYVDQCPHLKTALEAVKPKAILAMGNKPLYFFKGAESGIMRLCGTTEWERRFSAWLTWCVHPSLVLRRANEDTLTLFRKGIAEFARVVGTLS